ncbi:MAG: hypothetical protein AAF530_21165, partial [Pseudomonadota bacterium]
GIGDGLQTSDYARQLHESTSRRLRIWSDEPSAPLAGQARARLAALCFIDTVEITVGDAFAPTAFAAPRVDLAELSHMLYYVPEVANISSLVATIAQRLAPDGLAIFVHDTPGTNFTELLTRYSSLVLPDPVPAVAEAGAALSLPLYRLDFTPRVRFEDPGVLDDLQYQRPETAASTQTAQVVACLCQCSLAELRHKGLFDQALMDVRDRLDDDGYLAIPSTIQLMPAPVLATDARARRLLQDAVAKTASHVPALEKRFASL